MEKIGWPHAIIALVILIIVVIVAGYTIGGPIKLPGAEIPLTPPPRPPSPSIVLTEVMTVISPEQAIRDYYQLINDRQYHVAWARLSTHFKDKFNCCNPDGSYKYKEYVNWWDSVARVDVGEVMVIEQSDGTATVIVQLWYSLKDGRTIYDTEPRIQLVRDATTRNWLFYDKGP